MKRLLCLLFASAIASVAMENNIPNSKAADCITDQIKSLEIEEKSPGVDQKSWLKQMKDLKHSHALDLIWRIQSDFLVFLNLAKENNDQFVEAFKCFNKSIGMTIQKLKLYSQDKQAKTVKMSKDECLCFDAMCGFVKLSGMEQLHDHFKRLDEKRQQNGPIAIRNSETKRELIQKCVLQYNAINDLFVKAWVDGSLESTANIVEHIENRTMQNIISEQTQKIAQDIQNLSKLIEIHEALQEKAKKNSVILKDKK